VLSGCSIGMSTCNDSPRCTAALAQQNYSSLQPEQACADPTDARTVDCGTR
jgi:hypothetical protein